MRGIDFVKKIVTPYDVECIECTLVNFQLDVLYRKFDTEEEFKLELIECLKEFDYKFPKKTSLKKVCETIMNRSLMEEIEEQNAKDDSLLSELEEWQLTKGYNNKDSDVDIEINNMDQYDGFDIADESDN